MIAQTSIPQLIKRIAQLLVISIMPTAIALSDTAANTHHASSQQSMLSMLPMLLMFGAFFYFMIIRPQNKRAKQRQDVLAALSKDDEIVTTGGILGKIDAITDDFIRLTIADDIKISVKKSLIAHAVPKGTLKSTENA